MTIEDAFAPLDGQSAGSAAWTVAAAPARLAEIGVAGALVAVFMVLAWLGPRADLATAPWHAFFWIKAAYTSGLALAGLWAASTLTRPRGIGRTASALAAAGLLVFAMLTAAAIQASRLAPATLEPLLHPPELGAYLFRIVILAAPMLTFAILGLRRLSPERPIVQGFAAGLFSGGVAATIYGLHCPYSSFVLVGLWYTAAVVMCGVIGAALLVLARRRGRSHPE